MRRFICTISVVLPLLACVGLGTPGQGNVIGPIADGQGNQMWQDEAGHQTVLDGNTGDVWFAQNGVFLYGVNPQGQFHVVTAQGVVPSNDVPANLSQWPGMSAPLPGTQPQPNYGYQQQQAYTGNQGYQQPQAAYYPNTYNSSATMDANTMNIMMDMNNMSHETSMAIINNIPAGGTAVDHYDANNSFIGTW